MCIIIDTNCLSDVFCADTKNHKRFKPVMDWIIGGIGKMVVGGTKYRDELIKNRKISSFVKTLNMRANKVIMIDDKKVDTWQKKIEERIPDPDFDDPHLPAMAIVGKCRLICSGDTRSIKHVTRSDLYPNGIAVPRYYTSERNKSLLCSEYISDEYKPFKKCNKRTCVKLLAELPAKNG